MWRAQACAIRIGRPVRIMQGHMSGQTVRSTWYCHAAAAAYTDRTVFSARITTTTTAAPGLVVVRAG